MHGGPGHSICVVMQNYKAGSQGVEFAAGGVRVWPRGRGRGRGARWQYRLCYSVC